MPEPTDLQPPDSWMDEPITTGGILHGYSIDPALFEPILGRELDPRVYQLDLLGHRLLIARDTAEELHKGLIAIPPAVAEREQWETGAGWVVAVGPFVGQGGSPHPVGLVCGHPKDVLGKHVFFFAHAGKVFKTDRSEGEFTAGLVILTDRDIQAVDKNPEVYQPKPLPNGE